MIQYFFIIFFIVSFFFDIFTHKLPNNLCIIGYTAGISLQTWYDGYEGMATSLLGMIGLFFITFILYLCGSVGAGDVKWFAAVGSFCGILDSTFLLIISIYFAAFYAILQMIVMNIRQLSWFSVMFNCYFLLQFTFNKDLFIYLRKLSGGKKIPFLLAVLPVFVLMYLTPAKHFF